MQPGASSMVNLVFLHLYSVLHKVCLTQVHSQIMQKPDVSSAEVVEESLFW